MINRFPVYGTGVYYTTKRTKVGRILLVVDNSRTNFQKIFRKINSLRSFGKKENFQLDTGWDKILSSGTATSTFLEKVSTATELGSDQFLLFFVQ